MKSFNNISSENIIYTDGSCYYKDRIGGYAFKHLDYEFYEGVIDTTSNRMELTAILKALEYVKENNLNNMIIVSDSQYSINGCREWIYNWFGKRHHHLKKLDLKNSDLWNEIYCIILNIGRNNVQFEWTKGHVGNVMNERVDKLANIARKSKHI